MLFRSALFLLLIVQNGDSFMTFTNHHYHHPINTFEFASHKYNHVNRSIRVSRNDNNNMLQMQRPWRNPPMRLLLNSSSSSSNEDDNDKKDDEDTINAEYERLKLQALKARLDAKKLSMNLYMDQLDGLEKKLDDPKTSTEERAKLMDQMEMLRNALDNDMESKKPTLQQKVVDKERINLSESKSVDVVAERNDDLVKVFRQEMMYLPAMLTYVITEVDERGEEFNLRDIFIAKEQLPAAAAGLESKLFEPDEIEALLDILRLKEKNLETDDYKGIVEEMFQVQEKENLDDTDRDALVLLNWLIYGEETALGGAVDLDIFKNMSTLEKQLVESSAPMFRWAMNNLPVSLISGIPPEEADVDALFMDISKSKVFSPSERPKLIAGTGCYILNGVNNMDNGDLLMEKIISEKMGGGNLEVFYQKGESVMDSTTDERDQQAALMNLAENLSNEGYSPGDALNQLFPPCLVIASKKSLDVTPKPGEDLKPVVSLFSLVSICLVAQESYAATVENVSIFDYFPFLGYMLAIQATHEIGHRIVAAIRKIDISIPTLIPMVTVGTLGAITEIKTPPKNRKALFDFALAGPLSGFLVSLSFLYFGLLDTDGASNLPGISVQLLKSSSLGFDIVQSVLGFDALNMVKDTADPNEVFVTMSPMAIAGFLGIIVNALNLIPIGQLNDGARVSKALIGRDLATGGISPLLSLGLIAYCIFDWENSDIILFYLVTNFFTQDTSDMIPRNDVDDIDVFRGFLGALTIFLVGLTVLPVAQ